MNIIVESTVAETITQNGGAKASEKIIKIKATAMRAGTRLPSHLWIEIY